MQSFYSFEPILGRQVRAQDARSRNRKPRRASILPRSALQLVIVLWGLAFSHSGATPVSLTVNVAAADTVPPIVFISYPYSGTTYTSARTVTIVATASDNVGVARVEFYDGTILKGTATAAPYTFAWTISSASNGSHAWTAKAYDAAGNSAASSAVSVTVNIATADTQPPTVAISSPASGSTYTSAQTVTLTATASDNVGVTRVEFWDGTILKGTATAPPYTFAWTISSASNGSHAWTAKAYDAAGNSAASSAVSLTVNIVTADTQPPTVAISSPASGSTYTSAQTVTLTATASDNVGVTRVEFWDGTTLKGTATAAPYTFAWT